MKSKLLRYLSLCIVLILCLSTVACDLAMGGLVGEILQQIPEDQLPELPLLPGEESTKGEAEWHPEETEEILTEVETQPSWVNPDVRPGTMDFAGETFVILANCADDLAIQEENQIESLQRAEYQRNKMIEESYNVVIYEKLATDYIEINERIRQDVLAGAGDYNLVYQHMIASASTLSVDGLLYNLYDLAYVDFDNVWWDAACAQGFGIGEHLTMAVGDFLPGTALRTSAVLYNRRMADEHGFDSLERDVMDGLWTLDFMYEIYSGAGQDLNGDGRFRWQDDNYGIVMWSLNADNALFYGAHDTMFVRDDANLPQFEPDVDFVQNVCDRIYEMANDHGVMRVSINDYTEDSEAWTRPTQVFADGRAMFFVTCLQDTIDGIAGMADDYGVLPMPKYDKQQETYRNFVNGAASVAIVPACVRNTDMTGFMLEVLASSSFTYVTPVLCSAVAKDKNVETMAMVELIVHSKFYDFGYAYLYNEGVSCANLMQIVLERGDSSVASIMKKETKLTQKYLTKLLSKFGY